MVQNNHLYPHFRSTFAVIIVSWKKDNFWHVYKKQYKAQTRAFVKRVRTEDGRGGKNSKNTVTNFVAKQQYKPHFHN